jgi:hypothetical protein
MGENEFNELFGDETLAELNEAFAAAAAEAQETAAVKPVKDGLWYDSDGVNGDGHTISWYRLVSGGKTLLWFSMDNDLEVPAPAGVYVPPGVTVHTIRVHNATRTASVSTSGVAGRAPHKDGSGTHIDGQSVRAYTIPRVARWIAEFYGV